MRSSLELVENLSKREATKNNNANATRGTEMPKKEMAAKQTTIETPELIQKKRVYPFFEDLEKTSISLSSDISLVLAMEIDDLPTHKHEFRQGMQRAFLKLLTRSVKETKRVVVFNDAIPGFVLMLFKKSPSVYQDWSIDNDENTSESEAASVLAKQYFNRTKHRVVTVESEDALFVFFPVADLKKNLKEMGFYL